MLKRRAFKSIAISIAAFVLLSAQNIPANASTSLGNGSTTSVFASNKSVTLNSILGTSSFALSGYSPDQMLLAVVTTTTGTLQISTSNGLTLATGYQKPISAAAASIAFAGSQENINAALSTLKITPGAFVTTSQSVTLTVSNRGSNSVAYNAANGHYYEFVNTAAINWVNAYKAITGLTLSGSALSSADESARKSQSSAVGCAKSFNGLCGYFATSTSLQENEFISTKVGTSAAWLGGSDRNQVNNWIWYDPKSPEYKTQLSNGSDAMPGGFANWNRGEPNGGSTENAMQILSGGAGKWNDLREAHTDAGALMGYVVEYGGVAGEIQTLPSASRTVNFKLAQTYNVAYDKNQGTGTVPEEGWYLPGETFVVPDGTGISNPGYKFDGWYDGLKRVAAGSTYTMPNFFKSFVAQWIVKLPEQTDRADSMTPVKGLQGTPVTITGSFIRPVVSIKVDNSYISKANIKQTETTLTFTMPRHTEGSVKVTIDNGAEPSMQVFTFAFGKPVVPLNDSAYGSIEFLSGKATLSATAAKDMNTLIDKIYNLSGTKVVNLQSYEIENTKLDKTISDYNKLVLSRIKLISDALKKKMPEVIVNTSLTKTKPPAKIADLKSAKQYLKVTVGLKVS
jgi:hypothetical protein